MKYKKLKTFAFIALLTILTKNVNASLPPAKVHLFWAEGCPHCAKEKAFLDAWEKKDPTVEIHTYEISKNKENAMLLVEVGKTLSADISGVPITIIGDRFIIGYLSDATTGEKIKQTAKQSQLEEWPDIVGGILGETTESPVEENPRAEMEQAITELEDIAQSIPETIDVPFFGSTKIKNLSLPVLTFVIAVTDGFNPCAMWVLLFLISLLLGMHSRKKMWLLGGTFILASGFVYFLVLAAWLNLLLFLGFVDWVRILIGTIALIAGGYYVKEYFTNKEGGCKVVGDNKKRQQIFERLKRYVLEENLYAGLVGIALLAFAVNIVEFFCSAGLPAVYTNILTINRLPIWQYYFYLLFYVVIFMIDDLIVFIIAMTTLKAIGIESKYARYSHLVGGIIMLLIGFLMIFKYELLMVG